MYFVPSFAVMATQEDLDFTYTTIDDIFRLSMGETGDFSGAMFNGDFSLSLEEAQRTKHRYICENLNITKDSKVLDLGCGWGPFLNYLKSEVGAHGIGLTLSQGQAAACRKNGLEVYIQDCRKVGRLILAYLMLLYRLEPLSIFVLSMIIEKDVKMKFTVIFLKPFMIFYQ